jgi:hypothetical protein
VTDVKQKSDIPQADQIAASINHFKNVVLPEIRQNFTPINVINCDQSGINLESYTGRTLDWVGKKRVEALVQRMNPTTHSNTLFPIISANGALFKQIFVIFLEPTGAPQIFNQQLAPYKNIIPYWSRSGKMTAQITKDCFHKMFSIITANKICIMLDSWTGYNESMNDNVLKEKFVFKIIPKRTTNLLQPLDYFYNRQFKNYLKLLSNYIRMHHIDFILSTRSNFALIISLIHDQFGAPQFSNMIKYAFYGTGLLLERPGQFITPTEYCFKFKPHNTDCNLCPNPSFIRCSHCANLFCFYHFVIMYHHHYNI